MGTFSRSLIVGVGYAAALVLGELIISGGIHMQRLVWSCAGVAVIGFMLDR
ncbi:MAG TPA: hypothetical protein VFO91_20370 [Anaerolineales bacterium]|nr:hypothetical protein [Anaerolineales bacterium]